MFKKFIQLFGQTGKACLGCERRRLYITSRPISTDTGNAAVKLSSTTSKTYDEPLDSIYDVHQRNAILKVINEGDIDMLRVHKLAKVGAERVIRYRKKNGPFHSLEQVLEVIVDGFGMKILCKFCDNVVADENYSTNSNSDSDSSSENEVPTTTTPVNRRWKLFDVSVPNHFKKRIQSVVAVKMLPDIAAWSHVDRNMNIVEWNCISLDQRTRTYDVVYNTFWAREIFDRLPRSADAAYLVERRLFGRKPFGVIGLSTVRMLVQLEAVLMTMLPEDRLFSIETDDLKKFCAHKYGVRKPARDLLQKIIDDNRTVSITPSLLERYSEWDLPTKSLVAECVLRSTAFYETEVGNI